jgi:2-polyprenyl-3-methyl-5-hydroxy-6-metoxy-1,4-benzoquinol methylase
MQEFYDEGYVEPGITTELPDDAALAQLVASEFKGSAKDFSYHIAMLRALGVHSSARLLDFGANWGYASWQFMRAGWEVQSFEISRPRAAYGRKLGLHPVTSLSDVVPPFDVVFSCHVLEHVPNPRETLEQMLRLVRPGGLVVALTPNGSKSFRTSHRPDFQQLWGQVHPVLLTDAFVKKMAGEHPCLITSVDTPALLSIWDQTASEVRDCSGAGLLFAIRRSLN